MAVRDTVACILKISESICNYIYNLFFIEVLNGFLGKF